MPAGTRAGGEYYQSANARITMLSHVYMCTCTAAAAAIQGQRDQHHSARHPNQPGGRNNHMRD